MKIIDQIAALSRIPGDARFDGKAGKPLYANAIDILQINVGKKCNLSCKHCHVEAGPDRTELMNREILEQCLEILRQFPIGTVDITGGAPEMNPHLEWFITEASKLGRRLLVRSNLVILLEDEYSRFIDIYTENSAEVVASLPDYHPEKADRQRGEKVFLRVIQAMKLLNEKGYGKDASGLILDLVHNPVGAFLPGPQKALEHEYRIRLKTDFGVEFSRLFCITNCPVGRYLEYLLRTENYDDYMMNLINAFNPAAIDNVMCRTTLSVGWDGTLYDCDFNQMLERPVDHGAPDRISVFDFEKLKNRRIVVHNHCFSCTAGAGSSCQGALE